MTWKDLEEAVTDGSEFTEAYVPMGVENAEEEE